MKNRPFWFLVVFILSLPLFAYGGESLFNQQGRIVIGLSEDKGGSSENKATTTKKGEELPRLMVFNLMPEKDIDKGVANLLTEMLLTQINELKRYKVIGQKDLDVMLFWETNKQLKNCTDKSCTMQIAGAMGAEYYVEGSIGAIGNKYLINIKLIDVMKADVVYRVSEVLEKDENLLLSGMTRVVNKLFGVGEGKAEKVEERKVVKKEETEKKPVLEKKGEESKKDIESNGSGGFMNSVKYILIGCGVVGLGAGGYYIKEAMDANSKYEETGESRYKDDAKGYNTISGVMFGVGGVLVGSGILMWILKEDSNEKVEKVGMVVGGISGDGYYIGMKVNY